jgi:lysine 2,3-aminomutase
MRNPKSLDRPLPPHLPVEMTGVKPALGAVTDGPGQGAAALRDAVWSAAALAARLPVNREEVAAVAAENRLRIPGYYLSLIEQPGDPIWRQSVPAAEELLPEDLAEDPLAEDAPGNAPVPHLTLRYPDRALLLVTDLCPMFCRFCMRKRKTLRGAGVSSHTVNQAIAHIRKTPAIREVIVSGGDPLMLPDARLGAILGELRAIPHVEVLRVHTRMPCVEPRRVTAELAAMLARFRPLFLGVHFNHPREVTPQAQAALALLADAGLPLHNQTVLLRGVNDDPAVLAKLFQRLLRARVHPYYLHHADLVPGTAHFRTSIQRGLEIVAALRRRAPELAMLHYVLDTPGGGGKVPLSAPT